VGSVSPVGKNEQALERTMTKYFICCCLFIGTVWANADDENVKWKFKTEGRVYSSPIIEGDMIFIGSGDNHFYALDKTTGTTKWVFKTSGAVHSTASIRENLIYFASADGNLYAINKSSGELVWKFTSAGEKMYGLWDYYLSSPAVENGKVYWGSGDGHLYVVDAISGELQWKFDTGDIVHASPVLDKDKVYFGGFDGHMYALDKENGELAWKFKTIGAAYFPKGEIQKAALVEDGVVYFGSRDYNIYALDANTGRGRWNLKQPRGWIIATPIEHKGNIYFGTSDAHIFYSMDKNSGTVNWTIPLNMRVFGSACVEKDIVYFGTFDGRVMGIDHLTGETKWQFQTVVSKQNHHTIYDETGEFKEDFVLYGKDWKIAEEMIHALGSILSTPVIDNEIIYFGSSDGHIYAVMLQ
jgi:outer membrane protein assembly factor BamB